MRRSVITLSLGFLCVAFQGGSAAAQEVWAGKDGWIRNADARGMVMDDRRLYLATRNEVYVAYDMKEKWEPVFFVPSGENEIRCISGGGKSVFVGTKRGLFRSADGGKAWDKVFSSFMPSRSDVLSIGTSGAGGEKVAVGTSHGIFVSEDGGTRWRDTSYNLKGIPARCLAYHRGMLYAGCEGGLYVRGEGEDGWNRILVRSVPEEGGGESDAIDPAGREEEPRYGSVNCISSSGGKIYAGFDRRILYSGDNGATWTGFPEAGLSGAVNHILPAGKGEELYCATSKGVFEFTPSTGAWRELYKGIDGRIDAKQVLFDIVSPRSLWAVTDKGVYRMERGDYLADHYPDVEKSIKTLEVRFDEEPAFRELQAAAIRFADVSPDKIEDWKRESRLRAVLPKVSAGMDNDSSTNYEIYTSATRDYVFAGPDEISSGWDLSVSWELGDLIWSDDQTNIDVRSRLMVQLRNDILDDLRRAYYERKRVQFELITAPPKELKARFEKELRLQELTSHIDDLTGNYLSDHLKKKGGKAD
ncbi:MAG: hypothetical protein WC515_06700 [Candidatus Omnitrophota bacterium]